MDKTERVYLFEISKLRQKIISLKIQLKVFSPNYIALHKELKEKIQRHEKSIKHLRQGLTMYKQILDAQNGKH
jgi:uncharacterized protein (DUF342 family)